MFHLIGVNHGIQYITDRNTKAQLEVIEKFREYLTKEIRASDIKILGEEMSLEALNKNGAFTSIGAEVAANLNVSHYYCDPETEERRLKGIENGDHRKREEAWMDHLKSENLKPEKVLFVCGQKHVNSFKELLSERGIASNILSERWGENEFDISIDWDRL